MTPLQQAESLLAEMTQIEKLQLLQTIAQSLHEQDIGIKKIPGVCGGVACVADTRIPVWVLVQYRKLGASETDLLNAFPTLNAAGLTNAWRYYQAYPDEIEHLILANEAD